MTIPELAEQRPKLSDMVLDGVDSARLVIGMDPERLTAADLLDRGRTFFGSDGPAAGVATLMTNDRSSIELLLGAIETGARLVSLPIPSRTSDPLTYLEFLRDSCASQGITNLVVMDDYAELVSPTNLNIVPHSELGERPVAGACGNGFELVQFSSGSTGHPKGVLLSDAAIGANIASIVEVIQPIPGDCSVSWLPLSHDMGLVGMLLTSLVSASPKYVGEGNIVILDPMQFLRNPSLWLAAISEWRGAVTAAPDFGYRLCIDRAAPGSYDLSHIRFAIAGGETIRATTLHDFSQTFAASGFRPEAFCPAYGMAEVGLAISLTPASDLWTELHLSTAALAEHRLERAGIDMTAADVSTLVASGRTLSGYSIRSDEPSGLVGHLEVRGPSTGVDALTGMPLAADSGWMDTGDFGCVEDGLVIVSGRSDEYIVTHGRNLYAPTVEAAIGSVIGVRAGRAAIVGLPSGDWIVAVEPETNDTLSEKSRRGLVHEVHKTVVPLTGSRPFAVVLIGRGRLPITPSGKLQRNELRRRYLANEYS